MPSLCPANSRGIIHHKRILFRSSTLQLCALMWRGRGLLFSCAREAVLVSGDSTKKVHRRIKYWIDRTWNLNVYICWCTKEIKLCRGKRTKEGKDNSKEPTVFTVGFCIFAFILNYLLSCIPNKFLDEIPWFSHHNHMQGLLSISVCLGICPDFHSECNVKMN